MRWLAPLMLLWCVGCVRVAGIGQQCSGRAVEENNACTAALAADRLEDAEIACDHALEFSPDCPDLWNNKGLISLRRGDERTAKANFIQALRLNSEFAQAYNNLGSIYLTVENNPHKAEDMFNRALKVNPDYEEAMNNLALAYFKEGDLKRARSTYKTVVHINPAFAMAHHDLGICELQLGHSAEAIAEFLRAVQLAPGLAVGWLDLGAVYLAHGDSEKARDAFQACLDANPELVECGSNLRLANSHLAGERGRP